MPFLNTNYQDLNTSSILPEGDYEFVIAKANEHVSNGGSESIHFDLIARNDLDQAMPQTNGKHHNQHLFVDEWKRRATNQYDQKNLMYFMQAAGVPEGTAIETIDDFFKAMIGKPVRIHVTVEDNEYNGQTTKVNRPAPWNWSATKFPNVQHQWKKQETQRQATGMQATPNPFSGTEQPTDNKLPF